MSSLPELHGHNDDTIDFNNTIDSEGDLIPLTGTPIRSSDIKKRADEYEFKANQEIYNTPKLPPHLSESNTRNVSHFLHLHFIYVYFAGEIPVILNSNTSHRSMKSYNSSAASPFQELNDSGNISNISNDDVLSSATIESFESVRSVLNTANLSSVDNSYNVGNNSLSLSDSNVDVTNF